MTDSEAPLTWKDRVRTLRAVLGRKPTLDELLAEARLHEMTSAEVEATPELGSGVHHAVRAREAGL